MRYLLLLATALTVPVSVCAADRPNILFVISDDQSFPHASAYGCGWVRTPGFDDVAAAGVLFSNAYAPTPGCSPTRAAILTGRHAWRLREAGTHASSFPADLKVFPELLAAAGYFVGSTGKGWGPGNWKVSGRVQNPAGPGWNSKKLQPEIGGVSRNDYAANFGEFLKQRPQGAPFCFWLGASEPHRPFAPVQGASPEQLAAVSVPAFLPDTPEIRADLLAYGREVEWFDSHLARVLESLRQTGELANTIVIVTSDNGMAFPRAKANLYEFGIHMPLAVSWPAGFSGGRVSERLVSLIDLAPTILSAAGLDSDGMDGRNLLPLLRGLAAERGEAAVYAARERHSSSRFRSLGYPQRAIRTGRYLYVRNFHPERWPAGAPNRVRRPMELGAEPSGAAPSGAEHSGYHDIDACPSLTFLVKHREHPEYGRFLQLAVAHRPEEELFDVVTDPACLRNLAADPAFAATRSDLAERLFRELRATGDPRATGDGEVFETYPRYSSLRYFPVPEWARRDPKLIPKQPWWEERTRSLREQPRRNP